jgi:hypothetical protein
MSDNYNPNSVDAVLSRIEGKLDTSIKIFQHRLDLRH